MFQEVNHRKVHSELHASESLSRRCVFLLSMMVVSLSLQDHILVSGFVISEPVAAPRHDLLVKKSSRRALGPFHHRKTVNLSHPLVGNRAPTTSLGVTMSHRSNGISTTQIMMTGDDEQEDSVVDGSSFQSILGTLGLLSQPIVWVSLYFVKTTGGGLPAGPLGIIGLTEGIAYLVILGLALAGIFTDTKSTSTNTAYGASMKLSLATLVVSLLVVINLTFDQGCIPNAKPILDYSAYVKVC